MQSAIVVHYAEIGLKGRNRGYFVNALMDNMRQALRGLEYDSVQGMYGRVMVRLRENSDPQQIRKRLQLVPGIANFSFAEAIAIPVQVAVPVDEQPTWHAMRDAAWRLVQASTARTFVVRAKRAEKNFPLQSLDVERALGAWVLEQARATNRPLKVDVHDPELTVRVEIVRPQGFVYGIKEQGPGGLPVGTSGRLVSLLSAGFDSPVASYMMMKRGAEIVFVHFHAHPLTDRSSMENVRDLVASLNKIQHRSRLYQVPFGLAQQQIIAASPRDIRMVIYRRFMMRIASAIAQREKALGLVTGESLGQVASQTLPNMAVIDAAAELPVYRPLVGLNKDEIIAIADRIGTGGISAEPAADCCSLMVSKHPVTKATAALVEQVESALDVARLVDEAVQAAEVEDSGGR
jgi:thiamine biosynthesis protein ThiI